MPFLRHVSASHPFQIQSTSSILLLVNRQDLNREMKTPQSEEHDSLVNRQKSDFDWDDAEGVELDLDVNKLS